MLKIKENVDLKKLENFGFFQINNHYYYKKNNEEDYISICIRNRKIIIRINYQNIENILFNLINAGLVEKI